VIDSDGARKADLAAIHIGKAALGWDDDFYRSILKAKCGVGSAALLDHAGRKRFLDHLRACGWSATVKGAACAENAPAARLASC
jgi:phage gp16-like protein